MLTGARPFDPGNYRATLRVETQWVDNRSPFDSSAE
jgi:hypothetical protein